MTYRLAAIHALQTATDR